MAISAVAIGSIHGFPSTIAYGASFPVGTWIIIIHTGAGQGGPGTPSATDTAGNAFPHSAGAVTNNNNPCAYIQAAKLTHAVIATDTITPHSTVQGDITAYYLTGAPDFSLGSVTGKSGGSYTPFVSVHDTDLRLPAHTTDGTELILGGVSALIVTSPPDPTKALTLDVGGSPDEEGLGNWYTNANFQLIPPAGSAIFGAQVTGPSGSTADAWNSNAIGLTGIFPPPVITHGVDLITSLIGLHRAYRDGTDVKFSTLRWGAADWDASVTIASDADDTTDNGSVPCLAITDDQDVMVCWYHTPTVVAAGFISEDFGQTWDAYAAIIGHRYPRVAFMREKTVVGLFNADILALFESSDGGTTLDLAVTFGPQPKQRISLQVDGLNFLHAVWEDSDGQVIHRGSRSPGQVGSWSDPELLVSGHVPGYAVGHRRAVNCCFDEADPPNLNFGLTDSTYGVSDSASDIDTPAGVFFERAWVGLVWDVRDHLWLLARAYSTGHAMLLWKTENDRDWLLFGGGGGLGP